jgi:hypothetical protein
VPGQIGRRTDALLKIFAAAADSCLIHQEVKKGKKIDQIIDSEKLHM